MSKSKEGKGILKKKTTLLILACWGFTNILVVVNRKLLEFIVKGKNE